MSIDLDPADDRAVPSRERPMLVGLSVAAIASIGAGAVHAAATGIHAEHPGLARLFVICAIAQLGAGLWALMQPRRLAALATAAVNAAAVGGWIVTRLTGVSWIGGLETREAPQFADSACAALGRWPRPPRSRVSSPDIARGRGRASSSPVSPRRH